MKQLILSCAVLLFLSNCKKNNKPPGDYRDPFTGYYPVTAICKDFEADSSATGTLDQYTLKIVKENTDSTLQITMIDSVETDFLKVKVDIAGNFQSDSIPGLPRLYKGKFSQPSVLKLETYQGNSLGWTTCVIEGRKKSPIESK